MAEAPHEKAVADYCRPGAIVFDGTFQGFLCALDEVFSYKDSGEDLPPIVSNSSGAFVFGEIRGVPTDKNRITRLLSLLSSATGGQAGRKFRARLFEAARNAFYSDYEDISRDIALVVGRALEGDTRALDDASNVSSLRVAAASTRAVRQADLARGLVRFSELADGSLYAPLEPECDVLPLIGDHFASRFPRSLFAIHDIGRKTAVYHEPGKLWSLIRDFSVERLGGEAVLPVSEAESAMRDEWRRYFASVAIGQRANPDLQRSHMPKKYWKHLPEMGNGDFRE